MLFGKRKREEAGAEPGGQLQETRQQISQLSGELSGQASRLSESLNGQMSSLSEELNQRMSRLSEELNGQMSLLVQSAKKQQMAVENLADEWADYREEENLSLERERIAGKQEQNFLELYENYQEQMDSLGMFLKREDDRMASQFGLIEEKLEKSRILCGISLISGQGGKVDYDLHEIVKVIGTGDGALDERVAEVYSSGYSYHGTVKKKAKVAVYRWEEK